MNIFSFVEASPQAADATVVSQGIANERGAAFAKQKDRPRLRRPARKTDGYTEEKIANGIIEQKKQKNLAIVKKAEQDLEDKANAELDRIGLWVGELTARLKRFLAKGRKGKNKEELKRAMDAMTNQGDKFYQFNGMLGTIKDLQLSDEVKINIEDGLPEKCDYQVNSHGRVEVSIKPISIQDMNRLVERIELDALISETYGEGYRVGLFNVMNLNGESDEVITPDQQVKNYGLFVVWDGTLREVLETTDAKNEEDAAAEEGQTTEGSSTPASSK